MSSRLEGKTIVITGASSGIGREMAMQLAEKYKGKSLTLALCARTYYEYDCVRKKVPLLKMLRRKIRGQEVYEDLVTPLVTLKEQLEQINGGIKVIIGKVDITDKAQVKQFFANKELARIDAFVHCTGGAREAASDKRLDMERSMKSMVSLNLASFCNVMDVIAGRMQGGKVIGFGSVAQGGNVDNAQYALIKGRMLDILQQYRESNDIAFLGVIQGFMRKGRVKPSSDNPGIKLAKGVEYLVSLLELDPRMEVKYTSPVATTTSLRRFSGFKDATTSYNPKDAQYMENRKNFSEQHVAVSDPFSPISAAIIDEFKGRAIAICTTEAEKNEASSAYKGGAKAVTIDEIAGLECDIDIVAINAYANNSEEMVDAIQVAGLAKIRKQPAGGRILLLGYGEYIDSYVSSLNAKLFMERRHRISVGGISIEGNEVSAVDIAELVAAIAKLPPELSIENTRLQAAGKYNRMEKAA